MKGSHLIPLLCFFYSVSAMDVVLQKVPRCKNKVPSLKKLIAHQIIHDRDRYKMQLDACSKDVKTSLGYYYCRLNPKASWKVLAQCSDIKLNEEVESQKIETQQPGILAAVFIKANQAAIATAGGNLYIYDFKERKCTPRRIHNAHIHSVALSCDKRYLITASSDGKAAVVDLLTDKVFHYSHPVPVRCAVMSPDNNFILTGSVDGKARLFETQKGSDEKHGSCLKIFEHHAGSWLLAVAFITPVEIATSCHDHSVKLWNVPTGQCLKTIGQTDSRKICLSGAFAPSKNFALLSYEGNPLDLMHIGECRCQEAGPALPTQKTEYIDEQKITSIGFSQDADFIILGSKEKHSRLFAVNADDAQCPCKATIEPLATFNSHLRAVASVTISTDRASILCGDTESTWLAAPQGALKLWTFKTLARTLELDQAKFVLELPTEADKDKIINLTAVQDLAMYADLPKAVRETIEKQYTIAHLIAQA